MSFTFASKQAPAPPSVKASDITTGKFAQTSFGTIYVRATGGQLVKLGNPKNASHNTVTVKDGSYLDGRTDFTISDSASLSL